MSAIGGDNQGNGGAAASRDYARAILNILDDFGNERTRLGDTQRAVLNILEDSSAEKARQGDTQRAVLNILEDSAGERDRLEAAQRAVLNILEDSAGERDRLEATQKAVLNILEDSDDEKARLADTQRAALNILDDFDAEKRKVERINLELRNEVSERARAEEALRLANGATEAANRELEAFSYSVAHDLRAPLRSIDGFSLALLEDCAGRLDADGKRYLQNVRESAQQMGNLIDDLLNLSRVTRSELRREPLDLSGLAHAVLARLRDAQPDRQVEVSIQEGLAADADPRLLDIVLTNLFSNAWKFTRKRSPARIDFGARADGRATVYFVRDNGAGFDEAYAGKLFGVFQRLHGAHEFEGTGIGLATAQRIVRRHGGRLWAEGKVDAGATFHFTLEEEKA